MEIGVCGFGYSGSGAVIDLLKDYPEIFVADKMELSFIYKPDGLEDLMRAISTSPSRYFSSDSAIRRFIQYMERDKAIFNKLTGGQFEIAYNEFVDGIIQTTWYGSTSVHRYQETGLYYFFHQYLARQIRARYEKYFGNIKGAFWPDKRMYYSFMSEDEFLKIARKFVSTFIDNMTHNTNKIKIVLDQPFAANNPQKSFCFFKSPKAILVNKDPRDLYLLAKTTLGYHGRFIPTESVTSFINYYRGLMKSFKPSNSADILIISFEELIYDYYHTKQKIETFLDLNSQKISEFNHFNPDVSINNTQLWRKYPYFETDIQLISKELGDYLFDFEKYPQKPKHNIKSF